MKIQKKEAKKCRRRGINSSPPSIDLLVEFFDTRQGEHPNDLRQRVYVDSHCTFNFGQSYQIFPIFMRGIQRETAQEFDRNLKKECSGLKP